MDTSGLNGVAYKVKLCPILGSLKPSRIPIPIVNYKVPRMHKLSEKSLVTPVGLVTVETCDKGVHSIRIGESNDAPEDKSNIEDSEPAGIGHQTLTWLKNYFEPKPDELDLIKKPVNYPPICWEGLEKTEFDDKVLKALMAKVKYGETMAYVDLAKLIGKPGASRAAGNALKGNPVLILIPCHRIIRSDGTVGNYAAGGDTKKWLIEFEKGKSNTPVIE